MNPEGSSKRFYDLETMIQELILRIPIAGAFLACIWFFLKYIKSRDEQHLTTLGDISAQCHKVQAQSMEVIQKSIEVLTEMKSTLHSVDATMREMSVVVRNCGGRPQKE